MKSFVVPRRFSRSAVSMPVQCRTHSGVRGMGEISDISTEGCCVRPTSLRFRVGSRVMIRPPGMEVLTGVVRWVSAGVAGIEFDRPIYGPVLDHLVVVHDAQA